MVDLHDERGVATGAGPGVGGERGDDVLFGERRGHADVQGTAQVVVVYLDVAYGL